MLEHNLQLGMAVPQWCQMAFDEHRLSVEDIDLAVRDFTMDQQGHADPGHRFQHGIDLQQIRHPCGGIGGGVGGIKLGGSKNALSKSCLQLGRSDRIREVRRHQGRELQISGARRLNTVAVCPCSSHRGHRGTQVGHHDGPLKTAGGMGHNLVEHLPVAEMHVPIIWGDDRDLIRHSAANRSRQGARHRGDHQ